MIPQTPVIDVLFDQADSGWRLYVAPFSKVGVLRDRSGADGVIAPVLTPDFVGLDTVMWEADAPYERRPTRDGRAVQIVARGRSAETLLIWLSTFLATVPLSPARR